ncbi:hypothetical protein Sj15T_18900 [Sphingobium sp. TA15]|nr:hypothetical protein [Sphingobium indicum]BDD66869.1 hypothetical protein Sj15T_18900 [Sphingobium sp. TA15]
MFVLAVALAVSLPETAAPRDQIMQGVPAQSVAPPGTPGGMAPVLPAGTPVRLMVLKEINSRTARLGDRFKLRVDEPIYINGVPVVPVGSTAWGEIASVEKNGAVGKGGRLGAKLLYLDLPSGQVRLRGDYADRGGGNGAGVVLAVVGFGLLGLLTGGDSARLKAGDIFTGYVDGPSPLPSPPATKDISAPEPAA